MKRSTGIIIAAILLIGLALSGAYMVFPESFSDIESDTTLSITQINVDPQGSVVGTEYRGVFWNLVGYINANDDIAGVILPKDQTDSISFEGAVATLKTGAKIEIKIDPQQPYLIRDVQEHTKIVAPPAVGTRGASSGALTLHYYDWDEPTWRIYTPYVVSIYKDGSLVGSATLNGEGQSKVQTVSTSEGSVRIENLGTLGGTYLSPNTPSQIAILMYGGPNVYDLTEVNNILTNEFGIYWFGNRRGTAENGNTIAVNPVMVYPGNIIGNVFPPSGMGGWKSANVNNGDSGGKVSPVKPVIFSADKSSLPAEKRSFYSLVEYIQSRGVADLATSLFNSRATGDNKALWQKVSLVNDAEHSSTALRLDIPWGAFGTPTVNIRVPVELADTWIERPIETDAQVSAVWQKTGTVYADLSGSSRIVCTVVNKGTVTGGANLEISTGNSKLSVTPLQMTVNNLEPNVPQTVYFDASNLGVSTQVDNIPITIIAKSTYTGQEKSRCTLYGTLLPTLNTGQTALAVYAVEKGTSTPAANLQLQIIYGDKSIDKFADANGATGSMVLETPQGGAYVGNVVVQSADTTVYRASTLTYAINQAGVYEVTLEVERKDTDYDPDLDDVDWLLIAIVIAIIVAVLVAIGVAYRMRKKKKGYRRPRKR